MVNHKTFMSPVSAVYFCNFIYLDTYYFYIRLNLSFLALTPYSIGVTRDEQANCYTTDAV